MNRDGLAFPRGEDEGAVGDGSDGAGEALALRLLRLGWRLCLPPRRHRAEEQGADQAETKEALPPAVHTHVPPYGRVASHSAPQPWKVPRPAVQRTATATAEYGKHPATRYAQIAEIVYLYVPRMPIAHAKVPILMRSSVEGLVPQPDGNEYMETVWLK